MPLNDIKTDTYYSSDGTEYTNITIKIQTPSGTYNIIIKLNRNGIEDYTLVFIRSGTETTMTKFYNLDMTKFNLVTKYKRIVVSDDEDIVTICDGVEFTGHSVAKACIFVKQRFDLKKKVNTKQQEWSMKKGDFRTYCINNSTLSILNPTDITLQHYKNSIFMKELINPQVHVNLLLPQNVSDAFVYRFMKVKKSYIFDFMLIQFLGIFQTKSTTIPQISISNLQMNTLMENGVYMNIENPNDIVIHRYDLSNTVDTRTTLPNNPPQYLMPNTTTGLSLPALPSLSRYGIPSSASASASASSSYSVTYPNIHSALMSRKRLLPNTDNSDAINISTETSDDEDTNNFNNDDIDDIEDDDNIDDESIS